MVLIDGVAIVRPSSIWDTRAPFHVFIQKHRATCSIVASLTMAAEFASWQAALPRNLGRNLRKFISPTHHGSARAALGWTMYRRDLYYQVRRRRSLGEVALVGNPRERGEIQPFLDCLQESRRFLEESTVIQYSAMFETYVLCWGLNYLLAHLEAPSEQNPALNLSSRQKRLASKFLTRRLPTAPEVVAAFPECLEGLKSMAHSTVDANTSTPRSLPVSAAVNAWEALAFWRGLRNHLVHHSQVATRDFCDRHGKFWRALRAAGAKGCPPLRLGASMPLNLLGVQAFLNSHYRAARWLNDRLFEYSGRRRGHPCSPGGPFPEFLEGGMPGPKSMYLAGDYQVSVDRA